MLASAMLLSTLFSPAGNDSQAAHAQFCDDGSAPITRYGRPNWNCWLNGCSPRSEICWSDRLDHCFDTDGRDLGVCSYDVIHCEGYLSCFETWFTCTGEWGCDRLGSVGCKVGHCTITDKPSQGTCGAASDFDQAGQGGPV